MFFMSKSFLFVKIDSWNFQHLFDSGKLHKISTHSDNFYLHFFYGLSLWAQILQGFTKSEIKQMLKISSVYLYKQKKYELSHMARIVLFSTNRLPLDGAILEWRSFNIWTAVLTKRVIKKKYLSIFELGLLSPGVAGGPWHPQILADQLTLSQPGGQIMPTK